MPSFVANFQSPFDLDEFEWHLREGFPTNLGCIFEPGPGEPLGMWTVPKWAKVGDRVFFMCAATTTQHMAHVCKQAKESGRKDLIESASRERELYVRFASRILAVGRVAATPIPPKNAGSQAMWWAPIRDFVVLNVPIEPEVWKPVFKVSRTGSITKLSDDQAAALEELVSEKNPYAKIAPFRSEPIDDGQLWEIAAKYAGILALDPGSMVPVGTNDGGQTIFHYRKSVLAEDFDREFFGSGLIDIDYSDTVQAKGVWPEGTSPESIDVSGLDVPAIVALISAAVCGDYTDDGLLYAFLASGVMDRCLFRLAELEDPNMAELLLVRHLVERILRSDEYLGIGDASILGLLDPETADMLREPLASIRTHADEIEAVLPDGDRKHERRPVGESMIPQVVGFWQADDAYGYLSNWSGEGFDFLGRSFSTSEHWIMWQKACVMGDWSAADSILGAKGPKEAKALGGKAGPYDDAVWRDVREELAYVGVREKFLQNSRLAQALLDTGSSVLAEASPYDRVWGVGIEVGDPGFADMTGWKGENLQGRICMRVRADLRLLMPDGATRSDMGTTSDSIELVLASTVGEMSLLSLARNPTTRPSALCYARICQHLSKKSATNMHAFLMTCGQSTLAQIDGELRSGHGSTFTPVGWHELLAQLAFLRRVLLIGPIMP